MSLSRSGLEVKIKPLLKTAFEGVTLVGVSQPNFNKIQDGKVVKDEDAFKEAERKAIAVAEKISSKLAKDLAVEIVNHIKKADITCTIMMQSISVVGSPSAQVGPPTSLNISGTLK